MPGTAAILLLVPILIYSILILCFFTGWLRTKSYKPDSATPHTRVTILIPCRNEEKNIAFLASLLTSQDFPRNLLEIIWIDDCSNDKTAALLEGIIANDPNQHLVRLTGEVTGKKAALKAGMQRASGELILLTDADSRPGPRWVRTMAKFFESTGTDLILGPVVLDPTNNWFDKIQKLEYLSLVASSIGAAGCAKPIMAQGPNIAVRGSDYLQIVNNLQTQFVSGDDVFLLQAMKKISEKKIGYLLHPDAIVASKPARSYSGFLNQRRRWASKVAGYRDPITILTTLVVFFTNLSILIALGCALSGLLPYSLVLILLGIKTVVDTPLLFKAIRFFHSEDLIPWFLPVQFLYPIYIVIAGILSQSTPVRWK